MKTLDETIKKLEICNGPGNFCFKCPYIKERCTCDPDALHYLKEYQAILPLMPSLINMAIAVQKKGKTIG